MNAHDEKNYEKSWTERNLMGVPLLDSLNYKIFDVSASLSATRSKRLRKFWVTNEKMPGSSRSKSKILVVFFHRAKIVVGLFA